MKRQRRSGDLEDAIARADDARQAAVALAVMLIGMIAVAAFVTVKFARATRQERGEWGFMLDVASDELSRQRRRFDVDTKGEATERNDGEAQGEVDG